MVNGQKGGSWGILFGALMPLAFLMQIDKQAMVVLAPLIQRQYGFDLVTMTEIIAATVWSYAIFQFPGAWLAEKVGPYKVIGFCCLLWSLIVIVSPLSSLAWMFFLCRFAMGLAQAPDWTSSIMIIRRSFPLRQRSRASALLLGGLYAGTLVAGPLSVAIASRWSWQACFYLYGAAGAAFGLGLILFLPKTHVTAKTTDKEPTRPKPTSMTTRQVFASRQVYALGLSYFFLVGVQSAFFTLVPLYMIGDRKMSFATMGWLSSAPFLTLYISVLASGFLADTIMRRTGSVWMARVPLGVAAMIGSVSAFAFALSMESIALMMLFLCLGSFMVGMGQVSVWSSVQDVSPEGGGIIAAATQLFGHLALGAVPLAAAYLVQASGSWDDIRLLIVGLGIGGAIAFWFVNPHRPIIGDLGARDARNSAN
ncbi:MAG: MFS transporter [Sphingobium sp.]